MDTPAEDAASTTPVAPLEPVASPARPKAKRKPRTKPAKSPLDHDGNGRKGGVAPALSAQHLVVTRDDVGRGLTHGEVISASRGDVKALLASGHVRNATEAEVELAQPRVRHWTPNA